MNCHGNCSPTINNYKTGQNTWSYSLQKLGAQQSPRLSTGRQHLSHDVLYIHSFICCLSPWGQGSSKNKQVTPASVWRAIWQSSLYPPNPVSTPGFLGRKSKWRARHRGGSGSGKILELGWVITHIPHSEMETRLHILYFISFSHCPIRYAIAIS